MKIFGAIILGFIYTFYYNGGDTFNFHTHGSRHIWSALMEAPDIGLSLLFSNGVHEGKIFDYSRNILFFQDPPSFFVVRLAAFFDVLTFSSYVATACLFAVIAFTGGWMMFLAFYRRYPFLPGWLAFSTLFIPTVIFWGSGILKDTVMLACLGFITFCVDKIFIQRKTKIQYWLLLFVSIYAIYVVRKFMLMAFIPSAFLWVYYSQLISIKSLMLRFLIFPFVVALVAFLGYFSFVKIGEGDSKYSVDKLAQTARITAYDIAFWTGRNAGSTYSLGELDGTFAGMLRLAPAAVNVSLYRPYPWEVKSPLMALSAIESFTFLLFTVIILFLRRENFFLALRNQDVVFLLTFSIIFAFAAGITSYNFGTLSRYKIALMPFFTLSLVLILSTKPQNTTTQS